ncbi:hypothetical protein PCE1_000522 [Barthelona sp. PCE]
MSFQQPITLYSKDNYAIAQQNRQIPTFPTQKELREGIECHIPILLCHDYEHPHVFLFSTPEANGLFHFPIIRANNNFTMRTESLEPWVGEQCNTIQVLKKVACLYRPSLDPRFYPYIPPHCTSPRQTLHFYVCELPEHLTFTVPQGVQLKCAPLFDLLANAGRYTPECYHIPASISRESQSWRCK